MKSDSGMSTGFRFRLAVLRPVLAVMVSVSLLTSFALAIDCYVLTDSICDFGNSTYCPTAGCIAISGTCNGQAYVSAMYTPSAHWYCRPATGTNAVCYHAPEYTTDPATGQQVPNAHANCTLVEYRTDPFCMGGTPCFGWLTTSTCDAAGDGSGCTNIFQ